MKSSEIDAAAELRKVLGVVIKMLDQCEWDADTCAEIAEFLRECGYDIREPSEFEGNT